MDADALPALLDQFLRAQTPNTARSYRQGLRDFHRRCADPAAATVAEVRAWIDRMRSSGRAESTVAQRLAAVRSWYRWLLDGELVESDPTRAVRTRKPDPYGRARPPLDEDGLRRLMGAASSRMRAWLLFHLLTGLRRSEVAGMRPGSLREVAGGWGWEARVKGGKTRRGPVPAAAVDALAAWRGSMAAIVGGPAEETIWGVKGDALARDLKRTARRAGIDPKRVHVHGLRHAAARLRRKAGADIKELQEFLGHSNPGTTMIYLHKLEEEDRQDTRADGIARGLLGE